MPDSNQRCGAGVDLDTALTLHRDGRLVESATIARSILQHAPCQSEALHLLGLIEYQYGRNEEAAALIRRAISFSPSVAQYHTNLAAVLGRMGRPAQALNSLAQALRLGAHSPEVQNNLGVALEQLGRLEESATAYRNAISLRPNYPDAFNNLGNALRKAGRLVASAEAYRNVLALRPDHPTARHQLLGLIADTGALDEVIAGFRKIVDTEPRSAAANSALLYTLHYHPEYTRERLFAEHCEWDRRHGKPQEIAAQSRLDDLGSGRRLRVGYVSPDFRNHTVPRFIEPALTHHDRKQFEIYCYSDVERPDSTTERLRTLVPKWRDIRDLDDDRAYGLIRADEIDILIDLRGHGAANRLPLFARKPAPLQINMVGYFDTTGLTAMDWRLTDAIQDPPGKADALHTERLLRLPATCWCYRPDDDAPAVASPPFDRHGYITFGCLNKIIKMTPPCLQMWASILDALPTARLLLSIPIDAAETIRSTLNDHGLPVDRIDLVQKAPTRREYLERYGQIDIALDTFPFNGITTTCDGLWMGVPHVTLAGQTGVSRAGASILTAAGLQELVTFSAADFIRVAVFLARDSDRCRSLRTNMRTRLRDSALLNQRAFTAALEAGYLRATQAASCVR